ncbi:MAG TPA: HIRAN protein [Porticoccaceae bacterium]|nr:HIRAN protein [Porticoccaceae bacterium]
MVQPMKRRDFINNLLVLPVLGFFPAGQIVAKRTTGQTGDLLLQETPIAGFHYYDGEIIFYDLYSGMALELRREPDNRKDSNAIEIYCPLGKLGYVPRAANTTLAQMMDRGIALKAELTRVRESSDTWEMARFKVWV